MSNGIIKHFQTDKQQRCIVRKRYLRCPAAVRMSHLKKFIRMKYNLKPSDLVSIHKSDNSLSFVKQRVVYILVG